MKLELSRITAALLIALGLSACAPQSEVEQANGDVKVVAPLSDSASSYSLKTITLSGITELQTVSGKFAKFLFSPRISDTKLHGKPAVARFVKASNGDFIPANEISKQMASIYGHTQKLADLDQELGAFGVNSWPRSIGIGVRIKGGKANNAFYDGKSDSLLIVPYDQQNLPIGINGGILAHEHFHSLFYKIVLKDLESRGVEAVPHSQSSIAHGTDIEIRGRGRVLISPKGETVSDEEINKYYKILMLRAINEGLADFWGWMYTGNPDFIAMSLPSEKGTRSLKSNGIFTTHYLPMEKTLKIKLQQFYQLGARENYEDYVLGYSYVVGTQFSRMLKSYADVYAKERGVESLQARKDIAFQIVNLLPILKKELADNNETSYSPKNFVLSFSKLMGKISSEECEFFVKVINRASESGSKIYKCESTESVSEIVESLR